MQRIEPAGSFGYAGAGLYTVPEASRLLRAPNKSVQRWVEGYSYQSAGQPGQSSPLFAREDPWLRGERLLTFLDLIEIRMVACFRQVGHSLQYIRRVSAWASREFGTNHPLATRKFHTDGIRLYVEGPGKNLRQAFASQFALREIVEQFLLQIEYEGGLPARLWPVDRKEPVVIDPTRSYGKPVDPVSGVQTAVFYAMVAAGEPPEHVAWCYGAEVAAVRAAVRFEASLNAA